MYYWEWPWESSGKDAAQLQALFQDKDLKFNVWEGDPGHFNAGDRFDLVVSLPVRSLTLTERVIGVAWWPDGPVIKGPHYITEGGTVAFSNITAKPGGSLVVALDADRQALVDVRAAGQGQAEATKPPGDVAGDAIKRGAESLGSVLGIGLVAFIAYHLILAKVTK